MDAEVIVVIRVAAEAIVDTVVAVEGHHSTQDDRDEGCEQAHCEHAPEGFVVDERGFNWNDHIKQEY